MRRQLWQRRESVFTAGYPAVRTKRWMRCLREPLGLIRRFIANIMAIMGKAITAERAITVEKISTAVQAAERRPFKGVYCYLGGGLPDAL